MDFGEFVGVAGDEVEIFWWHFFEFFWGFLFLGGKLLLDGFLLGNILEGDGEWMGEGVVRERLGFGRWDEVEKWKVESGRGSGSGEDFQVWRCGD